MDFGRSKGWIGMELGSRTLKVAQLERHRTGLRMAASALIPRTDLRDEAAKTSPVDCPWSARDILAALSLADGFRGRRVACVLPMSLVDLHALALPPGDWGQRRAMVASELSGIYAEESEPRVFDFWEVEPGIFRGSDKTPNVRVLSAPRPLVQQVADAVTEAKLTCQVLDGLPCVMARAVGLSYGPTSRSLVAAVDWGNTSTTFTAIFAGQPIYARHLRNCGTGRLVEAVGEALGLPDEEAVEVLAEYGYPEPEVEDAVRRDIQMAVAEVTAPHMAETVAELEKTISHLKSQCVDVSLQRLCLLGDGAAVRNITRILSSKLELPVDAWCLPHPSGTAETASGVHPTLFANSAALSAAAWT